MTQDLVLSHQKNPHVMDIGLLPLSAFKVCHLVSKSPTANLQVMKESNFDSSITFLMTSFVKSFDRKFEKKKNIATL